MSLGTVTDKIFGAFLAFVSLMQGVEYYLWTHQTCDEGNRNATILGMILNHLQPLVLFGLILLWNPNARTDRVMWAAALVYLIVFSHVSNRFLQNPDLQCTQKGVANHLVWGWNRVMYGQVTPYYLFIVAMALIGYRGLPQFGLPFAIAVPATFISSAIVYPQPVIGALWCFWTALIPPVYYLARVGGVLG
jgi:hypothetical protein